MLVRSGGRDLTRRRLADACIAVIFIVAVVLPTRTMIHISSAVAVVTGTLRTLFVDWWRWT